MIEPVLRPGMRLHLMGIGGTGMSPLAALLLARGYAVSGCDLVTSPVVDDLIRRGTTFSIGHDPSHLADADLLVVSSAIPATNAEVVEARQRGLPVLKRAELVGEVTRQHRSLAVAGTHGKTTTTAMIALALAAAGHDPSALVGGVVPAFGAGARIGKSDLLVVEADEFDGSFLRFAPWLALITNVEADHLDFYADLTAIERAFARFAALAPEDGRVVVCADDARAVRAAEASRAPCWTYGFAADADWRAHDLVARDDGGYDFTVSGEGTEVGRFRLQVPGRHNVQNAVGAIAAARAVGADTTAIAQALADFSGVGRRFELKGSVDGVRVYDDYAHHPTEIVATLAAARDQRPNRLICIFQPHTYHRTRALFADFARAFAAADRVIVADIYTPHGREQPLADVSAAELARAMEHPGAEHLAQLGDVVDRVVDDLRPGDLVLTLGAGDVYRAAEAIVDRLQRRVAEGSAR